MKLSHWLVSWSKIRRFGPWFVMFQTYISNIQVGQNTDLIFLLVEFEKLNPLRSTAFLTAFLIG